MLSITSYLRMDSEGLSLSIEYVANAGIVLSTEQKAALQTSLVILQSDQKFHRVQLWGKIVAVKDAYYIAVGVGDNNELKDRKFLYRLAIFCPFVRIPYLVCVNCLYT